MSTSKLGELQPSDKMGGGVNDKLLVVSPPQKNQMLIMAMCNCS